MRVVVTGGTGTTAGCGGVWLAKGLALSCALGMLTGASLVCADAWSGALPAVSGVITL